MPPAKGFSLESISEPNERLLLIPLIRSGEGKKRETSVGRGSKTEPTVNKYSNNSPSMMTDGMGRHYLLLLTHRDDHYPFYNRCKLWGDESKFTEDARPE